MALNTTNTPELTAEQVSRILTKPLEAASVFLAAGPRVFDTSGPLRVPSLPGPGDPTTLAWTGEGGTIPEVDQDMGEVSLLPSTMKSVKVITRYSSELARQSVVSLEQTIRDRLVADTAAKLDAQFLSAAGDGITTPQGMFAWTGVDDTAVTTAIDPDMLLDLQGEALARNLDPASMRLFIRPDDYMVLRKLKDADGRYLVAPDASGTGLVVPILGARATVSARIPDGRAALVDMSRVAVARDLAPTVKVLTERYADTDEQAIRVVARYDVKPLDPSGVLTLSGLI